jgi:CelD/BcsL family acetyltransferase involved in cellulose biosynthesis
LSASLRAFEELSDPEVEAWRALAARSLEPNPYYEPGFVLPAARLLEARHLRLMVVEDGGVWLAAMPIERRGHGPLSLFQTWKHLYCFLGTPLLDRERAAEAAGAVARWLAKEATPLALRLAGDGRTLALLAEAGAADGIERLYESRADRAALERRTDGDYSTDQRPHRRREKRKRRRLTAELGGELRTVDRGGEGAAVERFLELERSGWKGREGTALACVPAHAEFFREICRSYAADGRLELLSLEGGGQVVAMECNFVSGDELFTFKLAYDERYGAFSPGIQLAMDRLALFHQRNGERAIDSCAVPENQTANELLPDRKPVATVLLGRRTLWGRLVAAAARAYSRR